MPAILDQTDWAKWLEEEAATVDELKACLKTVKGVNWKMAKEERPHGKGTFSDPKELF